MVDGLKYPENWEIYLHIEQKTNPSIGVVDLTKSTIAADRKDSCKLRLIGAHFAKKTERDILNISAWNFTSVLLSISTYASPPR